MIDNTLKLNNKKSIRLEIQHLSTKDDKRNWYGYGLEYNFNYNLSAYYNTIVNYENLEDNKPTYYSLGASYNKNASRFSVSYENKEEACFVMGEFVDIFQNLRGFLFQ